MYFCSKDFLRRIVLVATNFGKNLIQVNGSIILGKGDSYASGIKYKQSAGVTCLVPLPFRSKRLALYSYLFKLLQMPCYIVA